MILRTPVILLVCWLIGINTAIPFRINPKNIKQDTKKVNHLLENEETPRHFYQPPRRDKFNPVVRPKYRKALDYYDEYPPKEDVRYNSESSEIYPDDVKNHPYIKKTSQNVHKSSKKLQSFPNFRKISQDYSFPEDQTSDSTEDYSQEDSYYSDEDENYKDSTTSAPADSPISTTEDSTTLAPKDSKTSARKSLLNPEIEAHILEKNVIENWIPTNCSRSARKSNDRYSSSFVFNNTRDGLNEDTFPNPGEAEAFKHSSVFVGEDVTLCWIETITIKEDKSVKPPKKVVLREFTISFENSATIPEKYLECGKLEGEVEPGCHNHGEKSGLFDVIDEDSKVSKLVNFTTVSNKGNIEVRQHKNVRCAVGPVVTKNVIEFKDGSKNPKKRVEVKVSPRLRRMSEAGEACPSDQEKIDVPPNIKPGVKDLPENREDPGGKSNEFNKISRKPDGRPEELGMKPEVKPGRNHDKPEEVPDMIDKKPEEKPNSTPDKSIPHYDEENEVNPVGGIADGSSTTKKNDDIADIENPSSSGSPGPPRGVVKDKESTPDSEGLGDGDESCEGKSCKSEGYTQLPQYANTRKALKPSSETKNTSEESTTTKETKRKEDEVKGREPKSESCEGDSCKKCSAEDCLPESQSTEGSTSNKSVLDKPNKDSSREEKVTESSIGQETSRPEIDDDNFRYSTTEKPPTDVIIPTDRKPSVDTDTPDDRKIEKNKEDEHESCPGENCSKKLDESRTEGPTTKKLEDETKKKLIPSDESGATTSRPEINQDSKNKSELCEADCSTVPTKSSSEVAKEKMKPGNDQSRKSATVSPSHEEGEPSEKELVSFPTTRKSSSRNVHPSDVETESVAPDMQELDSEESGGHPTSPRSQDDETNVPDKWEEGTTKKPRHMLSHNLVRMEEPEKDLKCESESCSTSLDALSISPEDATKSPEGGKDSHKDGLKSYLGRTESSDAVSEPEVRPTFPEDTSKSKGTPRSPESHEESSEFPESATKSPKYKSEAPESPESTTKSPEGIEKSSEDISKSPDVPESPKESLESPESIPNSPKNPIKSPELVEESLKSPEGTTNSFKGTTKSKDKSEEAPDDELNSKPTTEYSESEIKYSKTTSEPEEITVGTSLDLEKTSPSRPKETVEKKLDKKERKHEPDDNDGMKDTYSDEEESSRTPSFVKTTILPEQQPEDLTEGSDSELKNRSGEIFLDRTPEKTTEMSLIERTTQQCPPDDEECNSKSETSTSEPVSENKEEEEKKEINQSTISNPEAEININKIIPDILYNTNVSKSPPSGKHRLGLRIKILLEHINENEERENLVEVDKHLLLNEGANDHDNNTILNQIKALNDSVTAQTIKALLNCSTLEKLTKKGISVQVNEAALVPKGKEGSKNLEPNEFILSVEDKGSDDKKVTQLRRKREIDEDTFKDDNSTTVSSTEENSTDANTEDPTSTVENFTDTNTEVPTSTVENVTDTNTEDSISTVPNSTDTNTEDPISTTENSKETTADANHVEVDDTIKNHSETIKNYLPDLQRDINTGINHVISKLKNCTTLNCSPESAVINFLPISNILGIISDPKDSRIKSRSKRDAEDYRKENHAFEKLDNWSNERIKRATGGHHLRSLTEFTLFREA